MKTLGEYSRHCREIDDVLKQAVNGIGSVYPLSETAMLCYILEHDGMVVIDYVDVNVGSKKKPIVRQDIVSVKITPKGRELLNRGGYSEFDPNFQSNPSKQID